MKFASLIALTNAIKMNDPESFLHGLSLTQVDVEAYSKFQYGADGSVNGPKVLSADVKEIGDVIGCSDGTHKWGTHPDGLEEGQDDNLWVLLKTVWIKFDQLR